MTILAKTLAQVRAAEALRVDGLEISPEDVRAVADLRPGDRVVIATPQGQQARGKVVITSGTHAALNMGGKYGRPGVVSPRNIVSVNGRKV